MPERRLVVDSRSGSRYLLIIYSLGCYQPPRSRNVETCGLVRFCLFSFFRSSSLPRSILIRVFVKRYVYIYFLFLSGRNRRLSLKVGRQSRVALASAAAILSNVVRLHCGEAASSMAAFEVCRRRDPISPSNACLSSP